MKNGDIKLGQTDSSLQTTLYMADICTVVKRSHYYAMIEYSRILTEGRRWWWFGDSLERLLVCSFDCHYKLFHQWNTFVSEVTLSEKSCEWWVNLSQKKQHLSLAV